MKKILLVFLNLVLAYLLAWTLAYVFLMVVRGDGLDFRYYGSYLRLAWTFQGSELPMFTWFLSLLLVLPVAALWFALLRRLGRLSQAQQILEQ